MKKSYYNKLLEEQKKRFERMENKKEINVESTRFLKEKYRMPDEDYHSKKR